MSLAALRSKPNFTASQVATSAKILVLVFISVHHQTQSQKVSWFGKPTGTVNTTVLSANQIRICLRCQVKVVYHFARFLGGNQQHMRHKEKIIIVNDSLAPFTRPIGQADDSEITESLFIQPCT